jgi:sarcosine oxidase
MQSGAYDVIVVGLGSMGSAACHHLAGRGARVLGLERFDIPHALGSHHGASRMIRLAYFEHPDYVALLLRAYELWDLLERESGQRILHVTGGLYLGRPDSELISGSMRAARAHGLAHEVLDRAQIAARFPQFDLPADTIGFHEARAGFLLPELAVATHAGQAMRRGAELHGCEPVTSWDAAGDRVTVRTGRGVYHARHLVFAGGAWSGRLVRDLGVELKVTRQTLGWFWPRAPESFALGRLPVWAVDPAHGGPYRGIYYGFPMMPDAPGVKIALHWPTAEAVDPDTVDRRPLAGDEGPLREAVRRCLPAADGPLLSLRVCLYTSSPDGDFIIDRHPRHERVTVACGFSGHGFKFASVIGEVLADLATTGRSAQPIGFLGLERFRR